MEGVSEDSWSILESFSNNELQVLKKSFPDIDNTLWEQLTKESKEPIVLLNRIVKGGNTFYSFIKIIEKEAERLEKNIPLAYNAYCIICAFFRVGAIAIPSSILQYLLIKIGESKMQIETFLTDLKKGPESERHAQALALSEKHRTFLRQFSDKLIEHLDNKNPTHRLFVARFFASILQQNFSKKDLEQDNHTLELIKIKKNLIGYVIKSFSFLDDFLSANTTHQILLVSVLRKIKDNLPLLREEFDVNYINTYTENLNRVEPEYIDELKEITSDTEALYIISWKIAQNKRAFHNGIKQHDDSNITLDLLKKWVDRKETPFYLKKDYLTFIEEWGTEEQKRENTNIIKKWSKESKYWDSKYWINRYLYNVRVGSENDLLEANKESEEWVKGDPYNIKLNIRFFYTKMLSSNSIQKRQDVLTKMVKFFNDEKAKQQAKFGEFFAFYLSSVSWGSKIQKKDAITSAKDWLEKNPGYNQNILKVRKRFLHLVNEWGTQKNKKELLDETNRWLENYPKAIKVKIGFIYLASWADTELQIKLLQEIENFLNSKSIRKKEVKKICAAYLYLASRSTKEEKEKAFNITMKYSKRISHSSRYIRSSDALLIYYVGRFYNKQKCLKVVERSFQYNPDNLRLRVIYLLLVASLKRGNNLLKEEENRVFERCKKWCQESWVSSDFWNAYIRLYEAFNMISDDILSVIGKWIEENPEYIHNHVKQYYESCTRNLKI